MDLLAQSNGDTADRDTADRDNVDRDNATRIDHELAVVGIGPGHPSLHAHEPPEMP
jgi:hypothetical protein